MQLPIKLNIGAGNRRPLPGYVTLDNNPAHNPDIHYTVPPIPLPDESVTDIYCSHLLEHLTNTYASLLIAECYRVLVPGGVAEFRVPYALTQEAFRDPTHVSYWVPERFHYYTQKYAYLGYDIEQRFVAESVELHGHEVVARLRKPEGDA